MNTIVMNTFTGAVSEYTGFGFDSITPTHAGSANGLFELGGDTDATVPIVAQIQTGKKQWGTALKKYADIVFLSIKGLGVGRVAILGETTSYTYNVALEKDGVSRCKPGRGIRENYLAFGFTKTDGLAFQLDSMEVEIGTSSTRRTQ
jgi:hypothetical protein